MDCVDASQAKDGGSLFGTRFYKSSKLEKYFRTQIAEKSNPEDKAVITFFRFGSLCEELAVLEQQCRIMEFTFEQHIVPDILKDFDNAEPVQKKNMLKSTLKHVNKKIVSGKKKNAPVIEFFMSMMHMIVANKMVSRLIKNMLNDIETGNYRDVEPNLQVLSDTDINAYPFYLRRKVDIRVKTRLSAIAEHHGYKKLIDDIFTGFITKDIEKIKITHLLRAFSHNIFQSLSEAVAHTAKKIAYVFQKNGNFERKKNFEDIESDLRIVFAHFGESIVRCSPLSEDDKETCKLVLQNLFSKYDVRLGYKSMFDYNRKTDFYNRADLHRKMGLIPKNPKPFLSRKMKKMVRRDRKKKLAIARAAVRMLGEDMSITELGPTKACAADSYYSSDDSDPDFDCFEMETDKKSQGKNKNKENQKALDAIGYQVDLFHQYTQKAGFDLMEINGIHEYKNMVNVNIYELNPDWAHILEVLEKMGSIFDDERGVFLLASPRDANAFLLE